MRWLETFCLSIVLALALVLSANAQSPTARNQSDKPAVGEHQRAQQESNNAEHSALIHQAPPQDAKDASAKIDKRTKDESQRPEWALFFLTIPYVIVSIGLLYITWRGQARLDRPWLFVIPKRAVIYIVRRRDQPLQYVLSVQLARINTGRSAAWIVGGWSGLRRLTADLPTEPDYSREATYGPTPAPPNQEMKEQYLRAIFDEHEAGEFLNGNLKIAVYGIIRYRGVLRRRKYTTCFCIFVRPPLELPTIQIQPAGCFNEFGGPPEYNRMT